MSDRALKACTEYARINAEIKALSRELSDALSKCRGVDPAPYPGSVSDLLYAAHSETHLKRIYRGVVEEHPCGLEIRFLNDKEICARLMNECDHCLVAHMAIQQRKAARRRLGATKAFITKIGKEAQ